MSAFINANEVAEKAKTPGSRFPIRGIVYPKEGGAFSGEGTLRRTDDHFVLHLTFAIGGEAPEAKGGTYSREDYWRFEGEIGANLQFVVDHLAPCGTRHWNSGITSQEYHTHTLRFKATGFDNLPMRTLGALLEDLESEVQANDGKIPENFALDAISTPPLDLSAEPQSPSPYANGTWIHALVLDFPLIHTNGGTEFVEKNSFLGESSRSTADTFLGSFEGGQFGLVRRGEDLNVYLFLPTATDEAISIQEHEELLTAFLTGLAFATGQHCWPYRVTIRQNGAQLLDEVHAVRKVDRTSLAPFGERIGFNAAIGNIEWQFADFLGKATQFFKAKNALSEAAAKALWLLRAAGAKRIPGEITLSSLCVLLESLTGLMFSELRLAGSAELASFEEAKREVRAWLEKHPRIAEAGFTRVRNLVGSASLLRPADKYRAVCDHFGLQWDGLMKEAWDTWQIVRHKSVHAALADDAKAPIQDHFTAIGRIAGAINVLVLRLVGYSGITRTSVYEDKHAKI